MNPENEQIRILDPSPAGNEASVHVRSGFADTKKVAILGFLMLVCGGVMAYQLLWSKGPQRATAGVASTPAPAARPASSSVESALQQLDAKPKREGQEELTVAGVEDLVKKFDTYVQDRQVPLTALQVNPFEVILPKVPKADAPATPARGAAADAAPPPQKPKANDTTSRLTLSSVMLVGDRGMASINGKLYQVGDNIGDLRVEAIEADRVILDAGGEKVELNLRAKTRVAGSI
jgi:hypothetical protein